MARPGHLRRSSRNALGALLCCLLVLPAVVLSIPLQRDVDGDVAPPRHYVAASDYSSRSREGDATSVRTDGGARDGVVASTQVGAPVLDAGLRGGTDRVVEAVENADEEEKAAEHAAEPSLSSKERVSDSDDGENRASREDQEASPAGAGLSWQSFVAWLGFKANDAGSVKQIDEGSDGSQASSGASSETTSKRTRSSKRDAVLGEGSDAMRDINEYLSRKELRSHAINATPASLDDPPDEVVDEGSERAATDPDAGSGMADINNKGGGVERDVEGNEEAELSDEYLRKTVHSLAKFFAALEKRYLAAADEEIRNHHGPEHPSVRKGSLSFGPDLTQLFQGGLRGSGAQEPRKRHVKAGARSLRLKRAAAASPEFRQPAVFRASSGKHVSGQPRRERRSARSIK
jgi:hypothetical protein